MKNLAVVIILKLFYLRSGQINLKGTKINQFCIPNNADQQKVNTHFSLQTARLKNAFPFFCNFWTQVICIQLCFYYNIATSTHLVS